MRHDKKEDEFKTKYVGKGKVPYLHNFQKAQINSNELHFSDKQENYQT